MIISFSQSNRTLQPKLNYMAKNFYKVTFFVFQHEYLIHWYFIKLPVQSNWYQKHFLNMFACIWIFAHLFHEKLCSWSILWCKGMVVRWHIPSLMVRIKRCHTDGSGLGDSDCAWHSLLSRSPQKLQAGQGHPLSTL